MPATPAESADARVFRFDQSGPLLRKVMESAAVGMTLVGVDGRMIYANRAYESMLGFAPGACLGMAAAEAIFDDDRPVAMLRFGQVTRGEVEDMRIECRLKHRDETPLWVLASASLLRSDQTGRPLYVIVQVINIERQKRAEAALAQSESRWNHALESAGQGVWDHDIRSDGMFYSRMWRRMRGMADDEYVDSRQDKWLERIHPDDASRLRPVIKKQDEGEEGYDTLEYRERHRDGHWIWILSRGKPVEWDADGRPLRTIGTDTDITRIKQTEAELAEEKERLRVTLESIADGVVSTDASERVLFMNPVAEALTGWAEGEAIGRPIGEIFDVRREGSDERAAEIVAQCLATRHLTRLETDVVLHARSGATHPIRGTAALARTEEGHVIGTVLVFQDITESRDLNRQLAHAASHDALTGLPNRSAFDAAIDAARRRVEAGQRCYSLCFIDLDRFKPVNDSAGHAAGDALLCEVADAIRACCRSGDIAARIGGDEFVLLLADCPVAEAATIATRLQQAIAGSSFAWRGQTFRVGASIGIAALKAGDARDPLIEADTACYRAKAAGRGHVVVSDD